MSYSCLLPPSLLLLYCDKLLLLVIVLFLLLLTKSRCNIIHRIFYLQDLRITTKTLSLWSYMNGRKDDYINPFYNPVILRISLPYNACLFRPQIYAYMRVDYYHHHLLFGQICIINLIFLFIQENIFLIWQMK